ncbi:MAG: hypothetical protein WD626_03420 [Bauldia sp.]
MEVGAQSMGANTVVILLAGVAVIAFVYALVASLKAWSLSYGHPDFDALGMKKWFMGAAVIAYMPPAALPYLKRYFAGFVVFALALIALALYAAFGGSPQGL